MTSNIEWTQETWNPSTGCDRISDGCTNCYALTMAKRLKGMGQVKYQNDGDPRTSGPGFGITMHEDVLTEPLRWKKPRKVFVNSMSDLFHKGVTRDFIVRAFAVMALTPQHTYQILTKRHARMRSLLTDTCTCGAGHAPGVHFRSDMAWACSNVNSHRIPGLPENAAHRVYFDTPWPLPNVHLGVSVENQKWADIRIPALTRTPAAVRFLSCEPLIGPVRLHRGHAHCPAHDADSGFCTSSCPDLIAPDWVIVGGESGPGARPFDPRWAAGLVTQCQEAGVAVFVKQLGSVWARDTAYAGKTVAAHGDTKGGNPDYWPSHLRRREYPQATALTA